MSRRTRSHVLVVLFVLGLSTPVFAQAATRPASAPRPKVPGHVLDEIERTAAPQTRSRLVYVRSMDKVIRLGEDAEKTYANASDLYRVRQIMLRAAQKLQQFRSDEEGRKKARTLADAIAQRILASDAPPKEKVDADAVLTVGRIAVEGEVIRPDKVRQEIQAYAKRYENTNGEGIAVINAIALCMQTKEERLRDGYVRLLESKYIDMPEARAMLRGLGRHPDVGRPFVAELTKLEGGSLSLPKDLKGKVLVIDFWATWCGPCVMEAPRMVELNNKYKSQGVEFIGISLDTRKLSLERFIKARGMNWTHTFTGKRWRDPTVQFYGIRGIPSIWVVGKDGRVVSDDARASLEVTIKKALEAKVAAPKD